MEWTHSQPRKFWPLPVELYEAGILTDKEFAGTSSKDVRPIKREDFSGCLTGLPGGKESEMFWLTAFIGRPKKSARAQRNLHHNTIKKHEQLPLKLGLLDPLYFLMYSTNEKISITQIEGQLASGAFSHKRGERRVCKGLAPAS